MDTRPIGVFDSGIGGLTVVKEIRKLLPNESIVYLGDTARVPYGTRSPEIIRKFAVEDANFLLTKGVKCLVVACNTASAYSIDTLRELVDVPVFDVIAPAAKRATELTKVYKVGVIGTRATILSNIYERSVKAINPKTIVEQRSCPLFVPLVEEGEIESSLALVVAEHYLSDWENDIDVLVLGCTHYPLLLNSIYSVMGNSINYINCGVELAKDLSKYLADAKMLSDSSPTFQCYVTDLTDRFVTVGEMFLGQSLSGVIEKVDL